MWFGGLGRGKNSEWARTNGRRLGHEKVVMVF
jgi:hypothetical protein